jgi:hypothetical protein
MAPAIARENREASPGKGFKVKLRGLMPDP